MAQQRPPASVVVLAWNAWPATQRCLDALRPTLGVHDQVVVVDNGSTDATARMLRRYPWAEVVRLPENRGYAAGNNEGARRARNPVLVFLNNDTVTPRGWLEALLQAFADPAVVAAGPRSNFVSGRQLVEDCPYPPTDMAAMRRFARSWRDRHRGLLTEVPEDERLVGFCLAVRRDAFLAVGGFDEGFGLGGFDDDDLCRRLRAGGGRLVVAEEAFVHHEGHATFSANGLDWYEIQKRNEAYFLAKHGGPASGSPAPLVSACLIVRDEEETLPSCLASLSGFADEVVVYDTGSADATREVARRAGCRVLEGYWDDDFSRARNAALEHCRGEWIAWLDADETLRCPDPAALRRTLASLPPRVEGLAVAIRNLHGAGVGAPSVHRACRLFRRRAGAWHGRLHEQVLRRADHRGLALALLDSDLGFLEHRGYLDAAWQARDKTERNLRVARKDLEDATSDEERAWALVNLGRSLLAAGLVEEGVDRLRAGADSATSVTVRRLAQRGLVEGLVALGRLDEALEQAGRVRAEGGSEAVASVLEGFVRMARREYDAALACFERVRTEQLGEDAIEYGPAQLASAKAQALVRLGRHGEAADVLLSTLRRDRALDVHLSMLLSCLELSGRPLAEAARALPSENLRLYLAEVAQLPPDLGDEVLEACFSCRGERLAVLAAAVVVAPRLPLPRVLVWASRVRAEGLAQSCPLLRLATDEARPAADRAVAAAAGLRAFADPAFEAALDAALGALADAEREAVGRAVSALLGGPGGGPAPPEEASPAVAAAGGFFAPAPRANGPARSSRPPGPPRASVVVGCRDEAPAAALLLEALRPAVEAGLAEVVVVDDGSTDATRTLPAGRTGPLSVVRLPAAEGRVRARNLGARQSGADVIVFLEPQARPQAGFLEAVLARFAAAPRAGVVAPLLARPDGLVAEAGALLVDRADTGLLVPAPRATGLPVGHALVAEASPVRLATGSLAVRRELFEALGGFDESLGEVGLGLAEADFCLRAEEAGWQVAFEPGAVATTGEGPVVPRARDGAALGRFSQRWRGRAACDLVVAEDGTAALGRPLRNPSRRGSPHPSPREEDPGPAGEQLAADGPVELHGGIEGAFGASALGRAVALRLRALKRPVCVVPPDRRASRSDDHGRIGAGRPSGRVVCVEPGGVVPFLAAFGEALCDAPLSVALALELGVVPEPLRPALEHASEVLVASGELAQALFDLGLSAAVVDPAPAFDAPAPDADARDANARADGARFRFLALGELRATLPYRNLDGALRAFVSAFTPGEGPVLTIALAGEEALAGPPAKRLAEIANGRADVEIRTVPDDVPSLLGLLRRADCALALHRVDALGVLARLAAACGRPLVATPAAAPPGLAGPEPLLVAARSAPVPPMGGIWFPKGATWQEFELDAAVDALRRAATGDGGRRAA